MKKLLCILLFSGSIFSNDYGNYIFSEYSKAKITANFNIMTQDELDLRGLGVLNERDSRKLERLEGLRGSIKVEDEEVASRYRCLIQVLDTVGEADKFDYDIIFYKLLDNGEFAIATDLSELRFATDEIKLARYEYTHKRLLNFMDKNIQSLREQEVTNDLHHEFINSVYYQLKLYGLLEVVYRLKLNDLGAEGLGEPGQRLIYNDPRESTYEKMYLDYLSAQGIEE